MLQTSGEKGPDPQTAGGIKGEQGAPVSSVFRVYARGDIARFPHFSTAQYHNFVSIKIMCTKN